MKNLQKNLMTVINGKSARRALTGVHFSAETNKMTATDSHRLISVKHTGNIQSTKIVNLNTLEEIDSLYPETEVLLKKWNTNFKVNMKHVTNELIKNLTKNKKNVVLMAFMENGIVIEADRFKNESIEGEERYIGTLLADECENLEEKELKIYMNGEYLRDMFKFIKDYNDSTDKEYINISCDKATRPIIVSSQDDRFDYLLTPIRIG